MFKSCSTDPFSYNNRQKLNITITVLKKDEALLHWWPKDALIDKDFEVVFMPEHARCVFYETIKAIFNFPKRDRFFC